MHWKLCQFEWGTASFAWHSSLTSWALSRSMQRLGGWNGRERMTPSLKSYSIRQPTFYFQLPYTDSSAPPNGAQLLLAPKGASNACLSGVSYGRVDNHTTAVVSLATCTAQDRHSLRLVMITLLSLSWKPEQKKCPPRHIVCRRESRKSFSTTKFQTPIHLFFPFSETCTKKITNHRVNERFLSPTWCVKELGWNQVSPTATSFS